MLDFNDIDGVARAFEREGKDIAAVIVEASRRQHESGRCRRDFIPGSGASCAQTLPDGAVLIFDEVMTGFRVGPAGRAGSIRHSADLTTLGKVAGGDMPLGAFGGRRDIVQMHRAARAGVSGRHAVGQSQWQWRRAWRRSSWCRRPAFSIDSRATTAAWWTGRRLRARDRRRSPRRLSAGMFGAPISRARSAAVVRGSDGL